MSTKREEPEQRRRSVPIAGWWSKEARDRIAARKKLEGEFNQKMLAVLVGEDEPTVSRCLKGKKPPIYEVAIKISKELDLPYPAILPDSLGEAEHLMEQRRFYKSDRQMHEIAAGVADNTEESQTPDLRSRDERQKPKGSRRKSA